MVYTVEDLPWDSIIKQENAIVEITKRQDKYRLIICLFQGILIIQKLQGYEAYFYDLAEVFAEFPRLKKCGIFGGDISKETGLAARDHCGVCAEFAF